MATVLIIIYNALVITSTSCWDNAMMMLPYIIYDICNVKTRPTCILFEVSKCTCNIQVK